MNQSFSGGLTRRKSTCPEEILQKGCFARKKFVCINVLEFNVENFGQWPTFLDFYKVFTARQKSFFHCVRRNIWWKKFFSKNYRFTKNLWLAVKFNWMWWKTFGKVFQIDFNCPEELLKKYLFFQKKFNFTIYSRKGSLKFSAEILKLLPTSLNLIFGEMFPLKEIFSQKQFRTLKRK